MRLVFAGTPAYAVPTLRALHAAGHEIAAVYTQPDRPAGRGRTLTPSAVAQTAQELGLPIEQPFKLDAEAQGRLAALHPALLVVVAYGQILPPAVLALPALGCVNLHASLLPRWRGAAPIARAIEAGDRETGVCLMQMDAGLDTGPVLATAHHAIASDSTAADLHDALAELGARLLIEQLPALAAGRLPAVPQAAAGACYARKLSKEEARLDWRQPAAVLARRVCAFNPAPVAWTTLDGERLRIWRASAEAGAQDAEPGLVLAAGDDGLQIASGDGRLRITELQRAGGRRLPVREALRGWNPLGRRFE